MTDRAKFELVPPLRHLVLTPAHCRARLQWCLARSGRRDEPTFTISRHTGLEPGVMVWGAVSFDSRNPLVVIRGTLTAQRYVYDNLGTFCYSSFCSSLVLFFSKNMPNHIPHGLTLPWPSKSPDLSPVEHVWDMMGW
ncbi:transposable element Tc1 transposase [Trichonephila clavipes]|nr:transposable element Tc1 transposase [Trichonephila clavipes]